MSEIKLHLLVVGAHPDDCYAKAGGLAALFRDERPAEQKRTPRPRPCHKRMTACFPTVADEGTADALPIRGDVRAWTWAAASTNLRSCHQSSASTSVSR